MCLSTQQSKAIQNASTTVKAFGAAMAEKMMWDAKQCHSSIPKHTQNGQAIRRSARTQGESQKPNLQSKERFRCKRAILKAENRSLKIPERKARFGLSREHRTPNPAPKSFGSHLNFLERVKCQNKGQVDIPNTEAHKPNHGKGWQRWMWGHPM